MLPKGLGILVFLGLATIPALAQVSISPMAVSYTHLEHCARALWRDYAGAGGVEVGVSAVWGGVNECLSLKRKLAD